MKPQAAIVAYVDPVSGQFSVLDFDIVKAEEHSVSSTVSTHPLQIGADITDNARPNLRRLSLRVRVTDSPINRTTLGIATATRTDGSITINQQDKVGTPASVVLEGLSSRQATAFQVSGGYPALTVPNGVPLVSGLSAPTLGFPRPFVDAKVTPGTQDTTRSPVNWSYLQFPQLDRVKRIWQRFSSLCLESIPVEIVSDLEHYPRMLITQVSAPRDGSNGLEISLDIQELKTAKTARAFVSIKVAPKPKEKRAEVPTLLGKKGSPTTFKVKRSLLKTGINAAASAPK